jgi:hypothetical protein
MTPKEYANELYIKFDNLLNKDFIHPIVYDNQLKKCALMLVDHSIKSYFDLEEDMYEDFYRLQISYLNEVKQEIEKL